MVTREIKPGDWFARLKWWSEPQAVMLAQVSQIIPDTDPRLSMVCYERDGQTLCADSREILFFCPSKDAVERFVSKWRDTEAICHRERKELTAKHQRWHAAIFVDAEAEAFALEAKAAA